jgi:hypothetical protein
MPRPGKILAEILPGAQGVLGVGVEEEGDAGVAHRQWVVHGIVEEVRLPVAGGDADRVSGRGCGLGRGAGADAGYSVRSGIAR